MNKRLDFGGNPDHRLDCFPDSSLLGDTESGINRLRCAMLQCRGCTSRHRHSNYDVITSPAHDRQTALVEVCAVRVLLVYTLDMQFERDNLQKLLKRKTPEETQ